MDTLIIAALAFIAGASLTGLYHHFRDQAKRIQMLEKAVAQRLPYKSQDAIEDCTAALMRLEQEHEIFTLWLTKAHDLLKVARNPDCKTR
jgi:AcrR family transcriptional regulator